MIHALKTYPEYFKKVRSGEKTFELRENDRGFREGDYLALNECDGHYTGKTELVKVTYIMDPNDIMPCSGNYVLMSIEYVGIYDSCGKEDAK